ncbi:MAG TPA: thioredoxin family protein [Bacilli bacterium]|jgi:glutaredoxin|nr:thioredoxin family protein [Bacilli bacterium]HPZ23562.1 thioredoxin family protein [Bacilli bacterium]HQC83811.1 thioredoxin family protein [Bacilli bacterium]
MTEITMISATWCPSCLTTKKLLKEILEKDNTLELNVVDYDLNINEIAKYNLSDGDVLPIIIINNNRLVGEHKINELEKFIKENKNEENN